MSSKAVALKMVPTASFEEMCREYRAVSEQAKKADERKKAIRDQIKAHLSDASVTSLHIGNYEATISKFPKDYFSLSEARESLSPSAVQMLAPFIKTNNEERLTVNMKEGESA